MQSVTAAIQTYHDWCVLISDFLDMLESAVKTPELLELQSQIESSMHALDSGMSVIVDYADSLTSRWNQALGRWIL